MNEPKITSERLGDPMCSIKSLLSYLVWVSRRRTSIDGVIPSVVDGR